MRKSAKFISSALIAVLSLLGIAGRNADAQEIFMPEEWAATLYKVPPIFSRDTLTICIMGDIMMHAKQIEMASKGGSGYDFSTYFSLIENKIKSADLAIANMEFTLAGEPYTGYPCFSAPDAFAEYVADCGFDIFLAANNHILDKGCEGAERTAIFYRKLEEEKGIYLTGLAETEEKRSENYPLVLRRKGICISFVNVTYGTNLGADRHWPKTNYMGRKEEMKEAMAKADSADFTIVLPHWGSEYQLIHSKDQEEMAAWFIENGADAIIGAHPHVVQDITYIDKVPVAYSLGNAVSNMSAINTQLELMITLRFIRHENGDLEMAPIEKTWLWCSRPGGFNSSYTVVPVEEYLDKENEWSGKWEYSKMVTTYERIINTTN